MKAQSDNPTVVLGFLMLGSVGAAFLLFTMMGGGFFVALLVLALLPLALLVVALESILGYPPAARVEAVPAPTLAPALGRSAAWGIVAALVLLGFYGGVMITVQGVGHTIADIGRHGVLITVVLAGFGLLAGLASHFASQHVLSKAGVALAGIGTGVGIVAVMSCCIVPLALRIPGLSGLALTLYLNEMPVTVAGIAANLVGNRVVAAIARQLRTIARMQWASSWSGKEGGRGMQEGESAVSQMRIPEVWYLLAATLSSAGVLLATMGYFPAWGTLLLMASAFCLALGLVMASQVSQDRNGVKHL